MPWQSWYILLAPAVFFPFLALRAEKMYRALSQLPHSSITNHQFPSLSIIIPARNEEDNLQRLLPTLNALDYPGLSEILVVDDNSTDQTARVAQSLGARVVCAGPLPPGWLGKPHACHRGAEQAAGDWLLFTDADTLHTPDGARMAVGHALAQGLDGVSVFLRQDTFGLDRSVLLAAFAGLYAGMHPYHPILNGQYILIRREAYFQSGGFAAVRGEPLEDLALAHLLKKAEFRVPLLRGEQVGSVRMYVNTRHLWSGMTRIGAGALKWGGFGGVLTALYVTGALIPILATLAALWSGMPWGWASALWGLSIGLLLPWAIRFGDWRLAFVAPFGALFVQAAAGWGLVGRALGRGVRWKGREVIG
ncbi:MAG: glycosyltransferase family 2 protein [Anaerolineales bacterium]